MNINTITAEDLRRMPDKEGLILQGCGGDLTEWVDGINEMLTNAGILKDGSQFENVFAFQHGELTCLLYPFDDVKLDIGKLALWRLQTHEVYGGTWLSDFVPNYLGGFIETPEALADKPDCPLIGADGNIFNLLGIASRTLREHGLKEQAKEMSDRVFASGSYGEALCIIGEWIYKLFPVNFVLYLLITFYNIRTLSYYFNGEFELVIKIWSAISIIVPILMLITHIRERFRRKEQNTVKQLFLIECIGLLELIILSILPVFKVYLAMPMDKGAFNVYMGFLFWCVVFGVSVFFVLFSNYLLVIKERQKYKEENLFFFGQLLSKLKSKTLSMTLICLTLTLSMALFFVTPLLVGWAQGFLEKRVPFDIQISSDYIGMQSGYIGIQSEKELPVTDYSFLDSFIEKNISVRDDCSFKTYFVNKTDFYNQLENSRKNASPITAISLSDYNHLLKMAGYDEISLRNHEFTTQWLSITPQDSISAYLEAHKSIKTDGAIYSLLIFLHIQ